MNKGTLIKNGIDFSNGGGSDSVSIDYGNINEFNTWSETAKDGEIFVRTDDNENSGGAGGSSIASNILYNNSSTQLDATNIQDAIDEVFQSVSNGKSMIADAITDKGIETSANDTFTIMADNINNISTGITYTSKRVIIQENTQHSTRNTTYTYTFTNPNNESGFIQLAYYDFNNTGAKWDFTIKDKTTGEIKRTETYTKLVNYGHNDATNLIRLESNEQLTAVFKNVKDDGSSTYINYLTVFYYT